MSKLFIPLLLCCALVAVSMAKPSAPGCEPPKKDPSECCDVPSLFDKAEMETCSSKLAAAAKGATTAAPAGHNHAHSMDCLMAECLLNSTKALVQGAIDAVVLKNFIKQRMANEKDWLPVMETVVDECLKDPMMNTKNVVPAGMCDPKYEHLKTCLIRKGFNACPDSVYVKSPECEAVKKYAETCLNVNAPKAA